MLAMILILDSIVAIQTVSTDICFHSLKYWESDNPGFRVIIAQTLERDYADLFLLILKSVT